jgi:putative transposase
LDYAYKHEPNANVRERLLSEKTGVRYHEVHIYRLLHKWGFSPKVPRKRFVNTASNKGKKQFKKRPRK